MLTYTILLISLSIGTIFDISISKYKNYIFIFNFLFLFFVVSLRNGIGPDYEQYKELFFIAKDLSKVTLEDFFLQENNIELGYLFLESFIKLFTDDFSVFIIFYNLILFSILFLGISRTKYFNIQLFLFFSLFHIYYISGHRQAMAMVIFLYNIHNLINKNFIRFLFFTFIAMLFHTSSIFFILFYFISKINLNKKMVLSLLILSLLFIKFDIIATIIEFAYINFKDISYIFSRVHFYYFNQYGGEPVNLFNYIRVFIMGILGIYFYEKVNYKLSYLIIIYAITFFCLSYAAPIAFRIADCFLIGILYYMSELFNNLTIKEKTFMLLAIVIYGSISFIRIMYVHIVFNINTFLPYKTIFE